MPPATNNTLEDAVTSPVEVSQGVDFVTHSHVELQRCAMHADDFSGQQCENPVVDGSEFCAECIELKLCKASGIEYQFEGNSSGRFRSYYTIPPHPVDPYGERTKRAVFCCDRCRNLDRDTKQSRERAVEIARIKNGGRSERYSLITNYCDTGQKVIVDTHTSRVVDRITD